MNPSLGSAIAGDRSQPYKTAIALALIIAALYAWWPHRIFAPASPIKSAPFISGQYGADTEAAWMARQIGRDIVEVIAYASTGKNPANAGLHFESGTTYDGRKHRFTASFVGMSEKKEAVTAVDYFWSPETFAPWARALLSVANKGTSRTNSPVNTELVSALTNPTAEMFMREDKRLSDTLTESPLDPELHEEAALLIGSFAMREASNAWLGDLRGYLCKMTAHLAVAKAIRGNLSHCGNLAEAILCSLTGRESPAGQIMEQIAKDAGTTNGLPNTAVDIWSRALRLRNTTDYRQLAEPEKATLLERLEYVRALRRAAGSSAASKFVRSHDLERLPEWGEQVLLGDTSVGDENAWAIRTLQLELETIATHYRDYSGKTLERNNLIEALNAEWKQFPKREATRLEVLGWGAWAEQHQRQLGQLIHKVSCWLGDSLGLPNDAADFEKKMTEEFGSLRLFRAIPFYARGDAATKAWIEQIRRVVSEHRELVTYYQWNKVSAENFRLSGPVTVPPNTQNRRSQKLRPQDMEQLRKANKPDPLIAASSWFFPRLQFGTLFDLAGRAGDGPIWASNLAEAEAAKSLAPSNWQVLWQHLQLSTNHKPTPEQTEAEFGALVGYDTWAMKHVAEAYRLVPTKYAEKYGALCWFEPERYLDLGNYLVEHGDEPGAAQAFQNAFDYATDRVAISNSMDWLVNYYFEHGKKEEAYKIANEGAEVYSQRGLAEFANLLDRMGQIENAESYLKKAYDRYPNSTPDDLVDFYARHRDKSPVYADEEKKFRAMIFPQGEEQVTFSDFHGPPSDGVQFVKTSPRTDKAGFKPFDVVVAVNGCRIHNIYQYYAARAPSTNPNVKFIVWRGNNYAELDSFFPKRPDISRLNLYKPQPRSR